MFGSPDDRTPRPRSGAELLARAGLSGVPRAAIAGVVAVVILAVIVVGWRLGGAAAGGEFSFEDGGSNASSTDGAGPDAGAGEETPPSALWIHVAGAVRNPGLYELPSGSRVGDAIAAAGGAGSDARLDAVNLARLLADGEQVLVPDASAEVAVGTAGAPAGAAAPGGAGTGGVDINRASAGELETLPGVGPATAEKIVADREANGPFAAPEDLMRVPGIGEKKFEAMSEMVVVR